MSCVDLTRYVKWLRNSTPKYPVVQVWHREIRLCAPPDLVWSSWWFNGFVLGFWLLESSKGRWRKFLLSLKPGETVTCKPASRCGSVDISSSRREWWWFHDAGICSGSFSVGSNPGSDSPWRSKGGLLAASQSFLSVPPPFAFFPLGPLMTLLKTPDGFAVLVRALQCLTGLSD